MYLPVPCTGDRQFIETAITGIKSYIIHRPRGVQLSLWIFVNPLEQYFQEFQKVFLLWPKDYRPTVYEYESPSSSSSTTNTNNIYDNKSSKTYLRLRTEKGTTQELIRIIFIDIVAQDYALFKNNKSFMSLYPQIFNDNNKLNQFTNEVFRRCSVLKLFIPLLVSYI
jgi:hypothetical protein